MSTSEKSVDVIVVGAGAGGHSAALVLGRARRRVILIDGGAAANLPATGIGGLLGHDRYPPRAFYDTCRQQLARYPTVTTLPATVASLIAGPSGPHVILSNGARLEARHIVLATGVRYNRPAIDGLQRYWGTHAFHCPFCHGADHCDAITVAVVHDTASADLAVLMTNWTSDVTAVVAPGSIDDHDRDRLRTARIHVEIGSVTAVHGNGDALTTVELADGRRLPARALLVPADHVSADELAQRAGLAVAPTGHIAVDAAGRTSVEGVWAVGDRTDPRGNLARAIASGSDAAIAIVRDLTLGPAPWPRF